MTSLNPQSHPLPPTKAVCRYLLTIHTTEQQILTLINYPQLQITTVMTSTTLEHLTKDYQSHLITKNQLATTLQFQQNIRNYKTIPKRYLPPSYLDIFSTPTECSPLTTTFKQKYHDLFFKHLEQVITHNTIALELEEAWIRNLLWSMEKHSATSTGPPPPITGKASSPPPLTTTKHHPSTDCPQNQPRSKRRKRNKQHTPHINTPPAKKHQPNPPSTTIPSASLTPDPSNSSLSQRLTSDLTIHNLSTYELTPQDIELLDKGLSFSPTPNAPTHELHRQIFSHFNCFAQSLRLKYIRALYTKQKQTQLTTETTTTSFLHRCMKFLPPLNPDTPIGTYTGHNPLENYIYNTKELITDNLDILCLSTNTNLPGPHQTALQKLTRTWALY